MRRRMMMGGRNAVPNDEIWYYAPSQVTLYTSAGVVSHTFADGKGVVKFNAPVTIVGQTLREAREITDVRLHESVTSIGDSAFQGCTSLALTSLPSGVTSIGSSAFQGCTSLALTSLPSGITGISNATFLGCTSLALTSLPSGVTSIGDYAFTGCTSLALTSLPRGVMSIGFSAFYGCTSLALTSIPRGITIIGNQAFLNCKSIPYLDIPIITPPTMGGGSSFGNTNFPIRVPAESVETYKAAEYWSYYISRIVAIPTE